MIKSLLVNHIKNNVPDSEVAVLLSGGVDSVSVGLAAESAGKEVYAYSFYLTAHLLMILLKQQRLHTKETGTLLP